MNGLCECGCGQPAPIAEINSKAKGWIKGQPKRFVHRHASRKVTGDGPNPGGLCECGCGLLTPRSDHARKGIPKGAHVRFVHGHNMRRAPITYTNNGYAQTRFVPSEFATMRNSTGAVMLHRLVMAQEIGRPLRPDEHVHHKNGNTLDNRPENLQIMSPSEHARLHAELSTPYYRRKGVVRR